jgi:hypothetical protein
MRLAGFMRGPPGLSHQPPPVLSEDIKAKQQSLDTPGGGDGKHDEEMGGREFSTD